jgi:DNA (cytosine-5)-methyltransferase 1
MRYLSLFSGIEAASVAWEPLGWECVALSEIDRHASLVLAHRYPSVPNLGDVIKITDDRIKALGPIDLVVGGSPCQDMSIAGKRKGLAGARSRLFHEQMRLFHVARKHCGARFLLWENVAGAFSSHKGRDFAQVVASMAGLDHVDPPSHGWGTEGCAVGEHGLLEWGTLDAQWAGVPQRRRRVFALLDTGDWSGRSPILLEPHSLRGDTPPSREKGQAVAALTANGVGTCGADDNRAQAGRLIATLHNNATRFGDYPNSLGIYSPDKPCPTLGVSGEHAVFLAFRAAGQDGFAPSADVAPPVIASDGGGVGAPSVVIGFPGRMSATQYAATENISPSLCSANPTAIAFELRGRESGSSRSYVADEFVVRRLTPVECERPQGFADDWTKVPVKTIKRPAPKHFAKYPDLYQQNHDGSWTVFMNDGHRYKMTGNSMAVPVMRDIGARISRVLLEKDAVRKETSAFTV